MDIHLKRSIWNANKPTRQSTRHSREEPFGVHPEGNGGLQKNILSNTRFDFRCGSLTKQAKIGSRRCQSAATA